MKFNRILAAAVSAAVCVAAWADGPFRAHRYDSFKATPTEQGQIVFAGNSITNMHSWFEAFGSHQEVIGRGNSGGFAYELLDNLESYIDGKPAKFFVMIGTNDVSSGQSYQITAKRIETIVRRVRLESPVTEVYVESILPRSNNAKPDYELCNTAVREWVEALGDSKVHFINLSEVCAPLGVINNRDWAYDGLHPRPVGYAAWTRHIQDMVGYPSVYPAEVTGQDVCGLSGSSASRVEQFPYFPVHTGDVLFFGDEQVHGGEWHELMRCDKIKDRGYNWGWGGMALTSAKQVVASALKDQAEKPAKIFLFYGVGGKDLTNYRLLVDEAKAQAPEAKIYIVSLTPSTHAETNAANVAFNTSLAEIATEKGATYVDIYTPLNEDISKNIMHTNYVSGRGYIVMANKLAEYLAEEQVNPVSLAEYEAVYARRTVRTIIGNALTNALMLDYGTNPGQVKEQYRAAIEESIASAVALINKDGLTETEATGAADALSAVVASASADINYPVSSTETDSYWYSLVSARGNKAVTAVGGKLVGGSVAGASTLGSNIWKFVERGDDTYDIVNFKGEYINPAATYNEQMTVTTTRPERGFSLDSSNHTLGNFVIYTSDSQLNQTNKENKIFNWYGGSTPDRADQGCSYSISLFEGTIIDDSYAPVSSGWYEVSRASDNARMVNMDASARQNANYSYSMQYVAGAESSPKSWIYLEVDDQTRYVSGLNGYYLGEFVANSETPYSFVMAASPTVEGAYNVQYLYPFNISGVDNVIGRSSNANLPHFFRKVSDKTLADYDVWTVLVAANSAAELVNNTKVTYASENNKGIATVYNNGKFFVPAGTVINPADITVTAPEGVEQERESAEIVVDADAMVIAVNLTGTIEIPDLPATKTLASGWYTLTLAGYVGSRDDLTGWVNTAIADGTTALHACETEYEQTLQGSKFYYHVGVSDPATLASSALTYFRVENPSLTTLNVRSQNGHHVMANGTAGRTAVNLSLSLTRKGLATLPICLWKNNNISAPHDLVGSFQGNSCIYQLAPADIDGYDVYTVNIIGETPAEAIRDDVKVTLNNQANRGLQAVYNGGAFLVDKGAQVAVSDVSVPAHAENSNPFISVEDGVITVDYTREQVSIVSVESAADKKAEEAFDLWGRRVASPRHGLYIVNGRKVRL